MSESASSSIYHPDTENEKVIGKDRQRQQRTYAQSRDACSDSVDSSNLSREVASATNTRVNPSKHVRVKKSQIQLLSLLLAAALQK